MRSVRWWQAGINGFFAAFLGLGAAWFSGALAGAIAWLLPVIVLGAPAALWQLVWRKSPRDGARVLGAWALASLVPFLVTRAWF